MTSACPWYRIDIMSTTKTGKTSKTGKTDRRHAPKNTTRVKTARPTWPTWPTWKGLYQETVSVAEGIRRDPLPAAAYILLSLLAAMIPFSLNLATSGGQMAVYGVAPTIAGLLIAILEILFLTAYVRSMVERHRLSVTYMKQLGRTWYVRVLAGFGLLLTLLAASAIPFLFALQASALTGLIALAVLLYIGLVFTWFGLAPFLAALATKSGISPVGSFQRSRRLSRETLPTVWGLLFGALVTIWVASELSTVVAGLSNAFVGDAFYRVVSSLLTILIFALAMRLAVVIGDRRG